MNTNIARIRLKHLFRYLARRAKMRFFERSQVAPAKPEQTIFGNRISMDLTDTEQKYLAADCVREPENMIVYRAIARSGLVDTFIDVGANCGHVATSVVKDYRHLFLFEPNPKLATLLRQIFASHSNTTIHECAIVDQASVGSLMLTVPDGSSGVATLRGTHLSQQHDEVKTYIVKASTLAAEIEEVYIKKAYIKIDVEGFEANVIESAKELIDAHRPIVGFEALSNEVAVECAQLFAGYVFYCARFDFMEQGGALAKSAAGIFKALVSGANIVVLRLDDIKKSGLDNFSQIFSVPKELSEEFEKSINSYVQNMRSIDLNRIATWSSRADSL